MDKTDKEHPDIDPAELVREIRQLVSLPTVCVKINQMVDENRSAAEIGKAISHDVDLSARLLKIANSPFYGFSSRIETISRAITVIGGNELRSLVLATSAVEAFDKVPLDIASMAGFWKHSLQCAIVSRMIAGQCGIKRNEQIFVAGLLHDIGHLVMFQKLPELEKDAMINAALKDVDVHDEERNVFGFDHAEIGGQLLKQWGLPDSLVMPVTFHHDPSAAPAFKRETAIIHIANLVAKNLQHVDYTVPFRNVPLVDSAVAETGFNEAAYEQIRAELPSQYASAVELFLSKEIAAA